MRRRRLLLVLGVCVALFILLRLFVLTGDYFYRYINPEVLYLACLAKDMGSGLVMDPLDYIYLSRQQGQMAVCAFAAPFYLLMGDSHFTLHFTVFVWSLITLVVWLVCLRAVYRGRGVALIFAVLYVLPPAGLLRYTLQFTGHFPQMEILLPILLLLLYRCFSLPHGAKGSALCFGMAGLVCGLGVYSHPFFLVTAAIIILYILLLRPRFFTGREGLLFAVFFAVGFLPKIYYGMTHQFLGYLEPLVGARYSIISPDLMTPGFLLGALKRCRDMAIIGVPPAVNYWSDYPRGIAAALFPRAYWYTSLFLFAYICITFRSSIAGLFVGRKGKDGAEIFRNTFPLALPLFFILSLGFTGISRLRPMQYFHMLVLLSYFTLINALALARMMERGRGVRVTAHALLACLLISAGAGDLKFIFSRRTGLGSRQRGTYYPILAEKVKFKIFNLGLDGEEALDAILAKENPFDRRVLSVCLGDMPWSFLVCPDLGALDETLKTAKAIHGPFTPYFWRGLGRVWIYSGRSAPDLVESLAGRLDAGEMSQAVRGAGAMSAFCSEPYIDDYRERIKLPEPHAHIVSPKDMQRFRGWRRAAAPEDLQSSIGNVAPLLAGIPPEFRDDFIAGVLDYVSWKHELSTEDLFKWRGMADQTPAPYFFPPMLECYL